MISGRDDGDRGGALHDAADGDAGDDEAEQHRPGVAHEDLRGVEVVDRNAAQAPARAAATMAGSARPSDAARIANVVAPRPVMPAARPSMPSVKLIMFTSATNQRIVSGYCATPRSPTPEQRQRDVVDRQARRDRDRGAGHLARELHRGRQAPDVVDRAEHRDQHGADHQGARGRVVGQEEEHRHQEAREQREAAQARRRLAVDAAVRRVVEGARRARASRIARGVAARTTRAATIALRMGMRVVVTGGSGR